MELNELSELNNLLLHKQTQLASVQSELDSLKKSKSWRITKPLRFFAGVIRKIFMKRIEKSRAAREYNVSVEMASAWKKRRGFKINPMAFNVKNDVFKTQRETKFSRKIKFSVLVPLFNTPRDFLQEMIGSMFLQTYENWELCLADGSDNAHSYVGKICNKISKKDKRVKYKKLERNGGISENTNACLEMATGDYISLFDHDDLLHPTALFETMKAICEKNAELVYTDEAIFMSPNLHHILHLHFKVDFSQNLFETNNYICHFTSFKKSLLHGLKFDSECDGAQDFDIILKVTENTKQVVHIRKCLYYWRASPASTALSSNAKTYTSDAGKRALEKHFSRIGESAQVLLGDFPNTYKIVYSDTDKQPASALDSLVLRPEEPVF